MDETAVKTALYDRHVQLGAKMVEFAGYLMPVWYPTGIVKEHLAVREGVGVFDLSHMGEFFIKGPRAWEFVQHLCCNDLRKIGNGGVQYTLFATPEGGVVDDLLVYQLNPEHIMMVVNASNIAKDWEWVNRNNNFGVELTNASDEYSLIAVQGPDTEKVLEAAGYKGVAHEHPFTFRRIKHNGVPLFQCVTGYTGERGFELIAANEHAPALWDELMAAGAPHGLTPIGLGARDTLRLEAGMCLYGHELSDTTSVLEANLEWTVGWNTGFAGEELLGKQKAEGLKRILGGITVEKEHGSPRPHAKIYADGSPAGEVTSGAPSPVLDKGIAFCYLRPDLLEEGRQVEVEVRGKRVPATVVRPPFVKHRLFKH
jgi:aminomethyltransferase